MMTNTNDVSFETISQSLETLSDAFDQYKVESNRKMKHLFLNRFPESDPMDTKECKEFTTFLRQKGLSTTIGGGGYTIPSYVVDRIQGKLVNFGSLRGLANVTSINSDSYELLLDQGSANVGWVQEMEERADTDLPEFNKLQIPVHELYAKPKASQKILDDSGINLEEWICDKISHSMAIKENDAFIRGDGDKKPKGILTHSLETIKSGQNGVMLEADALLRVIDQMRSDYLPGAVWVMSRSALSMVRSLKDASKRYLLQPSIGESLGTTLFGFPVYTNDALDQVKPGTASSPILFGNFRQGYQIVDRKDMSILRDPYSAKPFVEFYATKRVGGDVVNSDAIKVVRLEE